MALAQRLDSAMLRVAALHMNKNLDGKDKIAVHVTNPTLMRALINCNVRQDAPKCENFLIAHYLGGGSYSAEQKQIW